LPYPSRMQICQGRLSAAQRLFL